MEPQLNPPKTKEITKIRNEGGGLCIKKNLTHGFHRDCFFLHECNVCTLVVTLYQIVYCGNGFQEVLVWEKLEGFQEVLVWEKLEGFQREHFHELCDFIRLFESIWFFFSLIFV